ncbi:MAG: hypothetical protein JSU66_01580 [Deltaproteobacteria bacterium]|nr:MAG: hypothetical protein JSU66_01580 [Deltaproteobacteria bacterium]
MERAFDALADRRLGLDEHWLVHQAALRLQGPYPERAAGFPPPVSSHPKAQGAALALWRTRDVAPPALPQRAVPADVAPSRNAIPQADSDGPILTALSTSAMRCARGNPAAGAELQRAASATGVGGYVATHQLLFLVFGVSKGCVDAAEVEPLRQRVARRVYAELLAEPSPVDDLNLERMAMLCHSGLCNWVGDAMIQAVLDAQRPSGLWDVVLAGPFMRDEHATALAVYVLATTLAERRAFGLSRRPRPASWNGHLAFRMTAPERL